MTDSTGRDGASDVGAGDGDGERDGVKRGTFFVAAADDDSAVLRDVSDGQIHTLSSNPGVEPGEAVVGTVTPDPPLDVSWQLIDVERQWTIPIEASDESPTAMARELAAAQDPGDLTRRERADAGEIHVISVPEARTDQAVEDVLADEETTRVLAARLGVSRVEVRSAPGVVVVRYLP